MTDPHPDDVLGGLAPAQVRVRFCPSPTGVPHVGLARTALFNWAFARHHGGTMVFRIEDTDPVRDTEESYEMLLDVLQWLELDWDEGPGVGGGFGPYRQSQRYDVYRDVSARLLEGGWAYRCYCTPEELEERREKARAQHRAPGYDGHCRDLSAQQQAAYEAQGRSPALRFRMPGRAVRFHDLVRGDVVFEPEHVPDYVLVRASGHPLYTMVNPVDDALMRITHVLRGEDLLSSTPRQLALWEALREIGIADGAVPRFGHLPYVMGEGNRKLSKRDPEANLLGYRERGFLPEGLLNYLALLGWAIADDRDVFSMQEMVAAFDIRRVNPNPARFDPKKCEAINAVHVRALPAADLTARLAQHLSRAGVLPAEPAAQQLRVLSAATPLVQERMTVLGDAVGMLGFLFVDDADPDATPLRVDPDAAAALGPESAPVLRAARDALAGVEAWETAAIEAALRAAVVDGLGLKPKHAFGPVRVAVTGRRVSPPLFESLELLGRERTLARLDRAVAAA